MTRILQLVAAVAAVALMAGCAHRSPGYSQDGQAPVYSPGGRGGDVAGTPYGAQYGVVSSINAIDGRKGSASGAGAAIGAIAGAVIGRQFGFSSDGRATGTVLGAMGGAILGNEIEKDQNGRRGGGVRIAVQLDHGGARSFDFGSAGDLRVGDRVRIEGNQLYRM